jgi:CBS domain-containing protein
MFCRGSFDKQKRQVFTARDTDTLESVLGAIISNRLHRLYVVDDDFRPTAVITLTDIIRLFANY